MPALTAVQTIRHNQSEISSPPVAGNTRILLGAMVGITQAGGLARPYSTGDFFAGHALETVDNIGGAAGAVRVPVLRGHGAYYMTVPVFASTALANVGDPVWCATDNHADLSRTDPGTTLTTTDRKGVVHDIDPNGNVIIKFVPTV